MHNLSTRYKAVIHYTHFCKSLRKVSSIYGVSKSSLQRWLKATDALRLTRKRRQKKTVDDDVTACVKLALSNNPFITMAELAQTIAKTCKIQMSPSTASRIGKSLGFTRKKAFRTVAVEHSCDDVTNFARTLLDVDENLLISVDEAAFYVGDNPKYGYSPRGTRLNVQSSKRLRRSKLTLVMAITKCGVHHFEVLDSNCTKNAFVRFIERMPPITGGTLLMDNVAFHHSKDVKDALLRRQMTPLYNLPYSPRLNPIEYAFSSVKSLYRSQCPVKSSVDFDYVSLLLNVVFVQGNFEACFGKVFATAQAALENEGINFCGFDG